MEKKLRVPKRIQLETFYGCNARCVMCAISLPPTRKVGTMSMEMSNYVFDEFAPYADQIEKVDLFGLGEPMLDKLLFDRIAYAKKKKFKNIAISTNAELLDKEKQKRLLDSGIETVIFSIDGFKKETHEAIRKRLNFEKVVENCQSTIAMRDAGNYGTRFVVRMIRQKSNMPEWPDYRKFWGSQLSGDKRDLMIVYDVNTMGGDFYVKKRDLIKEEDIDPVIEAMPCNMVFDRFIVLNNGWVPLCCEDTPKAEHCFGNVNDTRPMDIFNSEKWEKVRELHTCGKKNDMEICKGCTVIYSERNQLVFTDHSNLDQPVNTGGR